jgi:hypothetical protein
MTTDELKDLWRKRSLSSAGSREGCLDEETFAALLSGELDSRARAEAGNHIALCQDCAEEFRALRSLRGLFGEERRQRSSIAPLGLALAATLLLAAGLGVALHRSRAETVRLEALLEQRVAETAETDRAIAEARRTRDAEVASLRESLDSALSPRLDAPIVDLDPLDATRGAGRDPVSTVAVSGGGDLVTLILNFPPRRPRDGFRVEVLDEGGGLRFEGKALAVGERASLNLTLSRAVAPEGLYRIRLTDGDRGIAEYRVRLRYSGERRK